LVGSKAPGVKAGTPAANNVADVVLDKATALATHEKDPLAMAAALALLDPVGQKVPVVAAD